MIRDGHYTDAIFVRTAAELLQRQIILYPVIPNVNDEDRVIISPSVESTYEPFSECATKGNTSFDSQL